MMSPWRGAPSSKQCPKTSPSNLRIYVEIRDLARFLRQCASEFFHLKLVKKASHRYTDWFLSRGGRYE
jgi:hypothetical protein